MSSLTPRALGRWFTARPWHIRKMATKGPVNSRPASKSSGPSGTPPNSRILALARYSPWSSSFPGTWRTRALIQSAFYAVGIVLATNYVDSVWFPPETGYASPREIKVAIEKLKQAFPEEDRVSTDPSVLTEHGSSDNSYHPASPHAVVVRALSTEDVVQIVKIASECRMPMVVYSGATSLEGHYSGVSPGSICIDMSGMDKILEIHEADSDLICQAGAQWEDINQALKDKGIPLFFPLDPGPGATIGGMVGTGCSGTNAVRYGTAKAEWFLNLTVVLPNGEVIKTRRRARKSSAGFDTTKLFIGAEGTLGIVTEATLRLAPRLPTKVAMAQFKNVEQAVDAVQDILNSPYGPHIQCVELLDDNMMDAINIAGITTKPLPVRDTLFFKIQGDDPAIKLAAKTVQVIVKKHGSDRFEFASTDQEAEDLWQNRKYALTSTMGAHPGTRCWTTDVCVPVSKLSELVYETKKDLSAAGLRSTIVGHVGDGNFHALILFENDDELPKVNDAVHRLVHRALDLDGTCTGEHGVGIGKKQYLSEELGEGTVELMRSIKKAVDPMNLLNPGKLYPDNNQSRTH
ncbi:D-lactate dehydrogenase cytochrome oxidoreductase [Lentinula aff. detonsa]|uniref:D-lactate dehydrogenase (cytochrome) n=1 Tax=Lentinula aff. detonsa TaxID=2804958 RepID=A0AA38NJV5_9AGAR|nr:D-lactate dehydrogenase cytochrome oxidoreductase [Lentinula aff. detonsa]